MSENVTVVFNDDVPRDEIQELVDELEAAGGKIKFGWFRDEDPIMNGFSANIPLTFMNKFDSFQTDGKIFSIESDTVVTIKDEERAPLVGGW